MLTRYRIKAASCDLGFTGKKVRDKLGWQPKVGLEPGLKKTVEWYRKAKESGLGVRG